jgi:hypothetical protein
MAKKFTAPATKPIIPVTKAVSASATTSTPVRNSPIPKVQGVKKEISRDQIAKRAYEIWRSGAGGSEADNWYRAIRELGG